MIVRGVVVLALLLGGLVAPPASAAPIMVAGSSPSVSTGVSVPRGVQAATAKPRAVVAAKYTVSASGRVRVVVSTNAKKVTVKYRTAKGKKRTRSRKVKKGTAIVTLARGSVPVAARARATSRLSASRWVAVLPAGGVALTVRIAGVPAGARASVRLRGPHGFDRTVSATQVIQVFPGTYTVRAAGSGVSGRPNALVTPIVSGSSGASRTVSVTRSMSVVVDYSTVVSTAVEVLTAAERARMAAVTASSVTFQGAAPVRAGDVIVSTPTAIAPYGLLRRVTKVVSSGDRVVVSTVPGDLSDVFLQLDLPSQNLAGTTVRVGAASVPTSATGQVKTSAEASLPPLRLDAKVEKKVGSATASATLELGLQSRAVFGAEMGWTGVKSFELGLATTTGLSAKVKSSADICQVSDTANRCSLVKSFPEARLGQVTFAIGPVPVVITFQGAVEVKTDLSLKGEAGFDATSTHEGCVGITYRDGKPGGLECTSGGTGESTASFGAEASVTPKVVTKIKPRIYDVLGPLMGAGVGLELSAKAPLFPKFDGATLAAKLASEVQVGGSFNLFGNKLEPKLVVTAPTIPLLERRYIVLGLNADSPKVEIGGQFPRRDVVFLLTDAPAGGSRLRLIGAGISGSTHNVTVGVAKPVIGGLLAGTPLAPKTTVAFPGTTTYTRELSLPAPQGALPMRVSAASEQRVRLVARNVAPSVPGPPGKPTLKPVPDGLTATWAKPTDNGGLTITKYTATAAPGGKTCTTTGALSCTITTLDPTTSYTVTVTATNSAGTSAPSPGATAKPGPTGIDPPADPRTGTDWIARNPDTGTAVQVKDGQVHRIADGATFLCLAQTRVVWDIPNLTAHSQPSTADATCDNTGRDQWTYTPTAQGGNTGTNIILRNPTGNAWLINAAGEIQPIPDAFTYLCLTRTNPVIWNSPESNIEAWIPTNEVLSGCESADPLLTALSAVQTATGVEVTVSAGGLRSSATSVPDSWSGTVNYICRDDFGTAKGSWGSLFGDWNLMSGTPSSGTWDVSVDMDWDGATGAVCAPVLIQLYSSENTEVMYGDGVNYFGRSLLPFMSAASFTVE